jgi:hypothetical protein
VDLITIFSGLWVNGRDGFMVIPILEPVVPNGYNFLLIYVPVGTKCDSYPVPNRVFTVGFQVPLLPS